MRQTVWMAAAIRVAAAIVLGSSVLAPVGAQTDEDAQSLCMPWGPPPKGGYEPYVGAVAERGVNIVGGVPPYLWRHGCGPTAAGMAIGYWDGAGYPLLVPGSASSQTAAVDQVITSTPHYDDYSLPIDGPPDPIEPDRSELGGAHSPHNCLGDFMKTSWSSRDNYYGWSRFGDVDDALALYTNEYVRDVHGASYTAVSWNETWGTFTWDSFQGQIDSEHPMVFLVDSDGDGNTDHFVTAIGYRDTSGYPEYACLDTWSTGIRWERFRAISNTYTWGIYGATYFDISFNVPPTISDPNVSPTTGLFCFQFDYSVYIYDWEGHAVEVELDVYDPASDSWESQGTRTIYGSGVATWLDRIPFEDDDVGCLAQYRFHYDDSVNTGIWGPYSGPSLLSAVLADLDCDANVDIEDFDIFAACMAGPGNEYPVNCEDADFDSDGDVDLAGFMEFQLAFTGFPVTPPADMVRVPAGEFKMGDHFGEGLSRELPLHDVYLDGYYIDAYEVTNQQYADALNWAWDQGGLIHISSGVVYMYGGTGKPYCDTTASSSYSRIEWNGSTFAVIAGKEDHPMVQVSWYGAAAFCNWRSAMEGRTPCYDLASWMCDFDTDGFRLPTEAEWEKAAGWDPLLAYHFRFGEHSDGCGDNCVDGQRVNHDGSGDPLETGPNPWTTPRGFYNGELHHKEDFDWPGSQSSYQTHNAQSYYGCRDMSGNAWEWCHDWYDETYYGSSPYDNPAGPASGLGRVLRGGAWHLTPYFCRSAFRIWGGASGLHYASGFRCVVGTQ